jgi:hypothetical protein|tara:strand:- start:584 stop:853 length:270 start_codon:yes stop_codon:yes gene_type:complete
MISEKDNFIVDTIVKNHLENFDENPQNVLDYCIASYGISQPIQNDLGILIQDINDKDHEYFKFWDKEEIKKVSILLDFIRNGGARKNNE